MTAEAVNKATNYLIENQEFTLALKTQSPDSLASLIFEAIDVCCPKELPLEDVRAIITAASGSFTIDQFVNIIGQYLEANYPNSDSS